MPKKAIQREGARSLSYSGWIGVAQPIGSGAKNGTEKRRRGGMRKRNHHKNGRTGYILNTH